MGKLALENANRVQYEVTWTCPKVESEVSFSSHTTAS
jgi:hypothetical protein